MHEEPESVNLATGETSMRSSSRVYEQCWSHLLHAAGILACVSPPLMRVLGLTPTSVLARLFLFMGEQSLAVKYVSKFEHFTKLIPCDSPALYRIFYLLTPPSERPKLPESFPY
jgi:hypothetical protein